MFCPQCRVEAPTGGGVMRECVAAAFAAILFWTPAPPAQEPSPAPVQTATGQTSAARELTKKQAKLRDQMSKVAPNSWIEARVKKAGVRNEWIVGPGRLKDTSADGFTLLVPKPGKVQEEQVHYAELRSFKRLREIEGKTPTEQAMLIPTGSPVTVHLNNKEEIKGLLQQISADGILVQVQQANGTETRRIPFADVKAISYQRKHGIRRIVGW